MRDPKRIEQIVAKLQEVWNETPDQRFLQLVYNIMRESKIYTDGFYVEDDTWLSYLNKYSERNKKVPITSTEDEEFKKTIKTPEVKKSTNKQKYKGKTNKK